MIRQGSSSWMGPTPDAGRARWATKAAPRSPSHLTRGAFWGVAFTFVVFFTVLTVAASMTPGGILSVPRSVANVLSQKAPRSPVGPTTVSPSGPVPAAIASPQATGSPVVHSPAPSPVERDDRGEKPPSTAPGATP